MAGVDPCLAASDAAAGKACTRRETGPHSGRIAVAHPVRRRDLVAMLGGIALAWPAAARADTQAGRPRRVGVLFAGADGDTILAPWAKALREGLQQAGWTIGRDLYIETRWAEGSAEKARKAAQELAGLDPDVVVATGTSVEAALQFVRTTPVVFVIVVDPLGSGFVESLSHPGGNVTGFMQFDYSLSAKWVELLKQVAPNVTRAAVIRDPATTAGIGQFAVIQSVAPPLGIEVIPIGTRDAAIEAALANFSTKPNGGLIVGSGAAAARYRDKIIAAAGRLNLPAVYPNRFYVDAGGLISYGADFADQYRRAAVYVDRILKGERPGDLPVQAPTRYDLLVNLKAAKALGLTVPPSILARADEIIE